jgi:hypothetical protein
MSGPTLKLEKFGCHQAAIVSQSITLRDTLRYLDPIGPTLMRFKRITLLPHVALAPAPLVCDSSHHYRLEQESTVTKGTPKNSAKVDKAAFNKDRRRKHHHYLVTVSYADGEKFGRVYTDKDKASRFADRQKRSPVVKSARITQVS